MSKATRRPLDFGDSNRLSRSRIQIRPRKMSAGHQQNFGRTDEVVINIVFRQSQIGGILVVEDSRKVVTFPDGQRDQAREPAGIKPHGPHVDVLPEKRLPHKPSQRIISHASDHRRPNAQARRANTDVAGASADIHLKRLHRLQRRTDLLAIKIDARATNADQIQRLRKSQATSDSCFDKTNDERRYRPASSRTSALLATDTAARAYPASDTHCESTHDLGRRRTPDFGRFPPVH